MKFKTICGIIAGLTLTPLTGCDISKDIYSGKVGDEWVKRSEHRVIEDSCGDITFNTKIKVVKSDKSTLVFVDYSNDGRGDLDYFKHLDSTGKKISESGSYQFNCDTYDTDRKITKEQQFEFERYSKATDNPFK